jgi:hypothetical protein
MNKSMKTTRAPADIFFISTSPLLWLAQDINPSGLGCSLKRYHKGLKTENLFSFAAPPVPCTDRTRVGEGKKACDRLPGFVVWIMTRQPLEGGRG